MYQNSGFKKGLNTGLRTDLTASLAATSLAKTLLSLHTFKRGNDALYVRHSASDRF